MSSEVLHSDNSEQQQTDIQHRPSSVFNWRRTSLSTLAACEDKILSSLSIPIQRQYVPIYNGTRKIWTLSINTDSPGTPLVLIHGMGSAVGLWVLNLESLSKHRPVYALDLPGFGRSTRTKFSSDPNQAELQFVSCVEEWRMAMGLEKMILLGHSLGGYLSASYCLHHSHHVKHLILADPWGFTPRPSSQQARIRLPMWARVVRRVIEPFNPFAMLRMAGPLGPGMLAKFRSDIISKFSHKFSDARIGEYLYHSNAQYPSGEAAFKAMTFEFGWARNPMIHRVHEIPSNVSMTLIYGSRSWVDYTIGYQIKDRRPNYYVEVEVIRESGHHVYADQPEIFNSVVNRTCNMIDRYSVAPRHRNPRDIIRRRPTLPSHLNPCPCECRRGRKQSTSPQSRDHRSASSVSSCDLDPMDEKDTSLTTDDKDTSLTTEERDTSLTTDERDTSLTTDDKDTSLTTEDKNTSITTEEKVISVTPIELSEPPPLESTKSLEFDTEQ